MCRPVADGTLLPTERFLKVALNTPAHLFPRLPQPRWLSISGGNGSSDTIEELIGVFASDVFWLPRRSRPGRLDPGRVRPLARDRAPLRARRRLRLRLLPLATRAGSGACACTSPPAPTAPPERRSCAPADQQEREVALRLLPLALRGGEQIICDKGYAGEDFERTVAERFGATVLRPSRKDEPDNGLHLSSIRQRIESIFQTLQRPTRARTPPRPHAHRPQSPHRRETTRARRRRLAQLRASADPPRAFADLAT